jgi:biotin carboxyl carrier protein
MDYRLRIGDEVWYCKADGGEENTVRITMKDHVVNVRYSMVSENQIHLMVDGTATSAFVTGGSDEKTVVIEGIPYPVQNEDVLVQVSSKRRGPRVLPQHVTPPMPAVVVRIMVSPGDFVSKGDGVVVVMAMKMESTLAAPHDGRVRTINVVVGDKVMPGQILVDIEKEAGAGAGESRD